MAKADKILINGKVYSVLEDNSILRGTAVAISGGRILKVGNDEEIKGFASEDTEVIDCGGNTILPGMCDAHCHPSIACASLGGAFLFGVYKEEGQSEEDVIEIYKQMLKEYVDANPDKPFIRGAGWIKGNFSENRWPNRHDLDEICPDKPVVLESFCQHNLWCNTKALELGGIDENTPDVETGKIVREADNYPSGAFLDAAAVTLVKNSVPGYELSKDEIKEMFEDYQNNYASRYGVTMVTDCMLSDASIEAYKELAEEGKLNLRMRTVRLLTPEDYAEQMPRFIAERDKYSINDLFR
ncbi:MAG: amidohydrolase family protein, partial [Firmicutes bacterium]|nr:amidohydrolase family protein [Bacillota bacterium]